MLFEIPISYPSFPQWCHMEKTTEAVKIISLKPKVWFHVSWKSTEWSFWAIVPLINDTQHFYFHTLCLWGSRLLLWDKICIRLSGAFLCAAVSWRILAFSASSCSSDQWPTSGLHHPSRNLCSFLSKPLSTSKRSSDPRYSHRDFAPAECCMWKRTWDTSRSLHRSIPHAN